MIKIDGYSPGDDTDENTWIRRSSNTIDDVIAGVTLNLHGVTGNDVDGYSSVEVSLTRDTEAYLGALLCCECGLCTQFGCPLYLDPCRMNQEVKAQLREQGVAHEAAPESVPSPFWDVKKVPTARLVARLNLTGYERHLPLRAEPVRPEEVRLPLRQGVGQPARPVVAVGQDLSAGQPVAEPGGQISAAVHASIAGTVTGVSEEFVVMRRTQ